MRYEYLKKNNCTTDQLNDLGIMMWELVAIIPPFNDMSTRETNINIVYIFKRKLI